MEHTMSRSSVTKSAPITSSQIVAHLDLETGEAA